jgi:hypothetical protein
MSLNTEWSISQSRITHVMVCIILATIINCLLTPRLMMVGLDGGQLVRNRGRGIVVDALQRALFS